MFQLDCVMNSDPQKDQQQYSLELQLQRERERGREIEREGGRERVKDCKLFLTMSMKVFQSVQSINLCMYHDDGQMSDRGLPDQVQE